MERDEFYQTVEQRAELADREDAVDATRAVVRTLGEQLETDDAQRLHGELPEGIGDELTEGSDDERLSGEEFNQRIEKRATRVDTGDAETVAVAVVTTLLEHVDETERERLLERLEAFGYDELLEDIEAIDAG
ncbi:hypothetical protein HALLA_18635 [Halostagnicola larsenii XH-48]|uniref:DUF2267 domain-containing protein n=1 Tax=Halostagnicola larsenii XH-48 TaxID=797299 RepID=W0JR05_9EURY|nr:DUF2267 domain-containing protein [Halostagnicola larsenii]AHG01166.1 hypothetical protein HALLA_18635 [Halostagnicola larsenii XH-48]